MSPLAQCAAVAVDGGSHATVCGSCGGWGLPPENAAAPRRVPGCCCACWLAPLLSAVGLVSCPFCPAEFTTLTCIPGMIRCVGGVGVLAAGGRRACYLMLLLRRRLFAAVFYNTEQQGIWLLWMLELMLAC